MNEYQVSELIEVLKDIKDELKDLNSNVLYVANNINDTYKNYETIERRLGAISGHLEMISYK
ncbi:hypothetical protein ACQCT6_14105 [Cytobacillus gottheilii]|uniref:hypothetical protein n=1 Tax=Cytobacillus gottheilii TaxID=859144 RepID=UPI003CEEDCF1